jgi:hypothetical protein
VDDAQGPDAIDDRIGTDLQLEAVNGFGPVGEDIECGLFGNAERDDKNGVGSVPGAGIPASRPRWRLGPAECLNAYDFDPGAFDLTSINLDHIAVAKRF